MAQCAVTALKPNSGVSRSLTRKNSDEICLGQNTHESSALDNREATYLPLQQNARSLNQRRVGTGRDDVAAHHLFDQQAIEHLSLRMLTVTERVCQRAAKEISLAQNSGQAAVIFKYR